MEKPAISLFCSILLAASAFAESQTVPIRPHPRNPRYLEFKGQPTMLITSAEHYGAVINLDFDWEKYLETLTEDGMNYTRLFIASMIEGEQSIGWMKYNNTLAPRPEKLLTPWARSEIPGYQNGGHKFNLVWWDEKYFKRRRAFIATASRKSIVVEVTLFGNQYGDKHWVDSPLNASNNIQGVGRRWNDFLNLRDPALTRRQEDLARKMVTELKNSDNVIFEICNEPFNDNLDTQAVIEWHKHMARFIFEPGKAYWIYLHHSTHKKYGSFI